MNAMQHSKLKTLFLPFCRFMCPLFSASLSLLPCLCPKLRHSKRLFEKCLAVKTATTSTKSADADYRNARVLQPAAAGYRPLGMAALVSL